MTRSVPLSQAAASSGRRRGRALSARARDVFLEALSDGWSVTHAAASAGTDRRRLYELRADDAAFAEAWEEAVERGTERLEQHAMELALTGVMVEVRDGAGKLLRTERRPDPTMVRFLLAARKPEIYSERARVEVTGAGGGPVELQADYRPTTLADLFAFARQHGLDEPDVIDGDVDEDGPLELPEAPA